MQVEIKLDNWNLCDGCPLLGFSETIPGRCGSGYYFCSKKYNIQEEGKDAPDEEKDIIRPDKCIEENGL